MAHVQPGTTQTVAVRVSRVPGPRIAPEDFARRYLALCTALGLDAALTEGGKGVEFIGEGLEADGPEDVLAGGLAALLEARFDL